MTVDWLCGWPSDLTRCEFGGLDLKGIDPLVMTRMRAGVRGLSGNLTVPLTGCVTDLQQVT